MNVNIGNFKQKVCSNTNNDSLVNIKQLDMITLKRKIAKKAGFSVTKFYKKLPVSPYEREKLAIKIEQEKTEAKLDLKSLASGRRNMKNPLFGKLNAGKVVSDWTGESGCSNESCESSSLRASDILNEVDERIKMFQEKQRVEMEAFVSDLKSYMQSVSKLHEDSLRSDSSDVKPSMESMRTEAAITSSHVADNKENVMRQKNMDGGIGSKGYLKLPGQKNVLKNEVSLALAVVAKKATSPKRRYKQRLPRPDIPIPVALPDTLCHRNAFPASDMDGLATGMDHLLQELPDNAHGDANNYLSSPAYSRGIVEYLQQEEEQNIINPAFLGEDTEVNPHMRSILIDWMMQVQNHLNIEQSTLHLAVRMLDKFVVCQKVALAKFQLVGITCLLLAAKFEERVPPSMDKLIHLTDNTYKDADVIDMERVVLRVLCFKMHLPIPSEFLDHFLRCVPKTDILESHAKLVHNLCLYLLDLTLHDIHMVQWSASMVTAATILLTIKIITQYYQPKVDEHSMQACDDRLSGLWTSTLQYYTSFTEAMLEPCMQRIAKLLSRVEKSKYQAARKKYQSKTCYNAVSLWPGLHTPFVTDSYMTRI